MKNLVNKGFKYFVAIMMVFSLMSMNAWANGPESGTSSETGSTTTENKGTTKDTGDSQGDTADQLISNEEKKTTTSKESDDKEGQTDQTTDKKTDYTYEDKKISVKAVLANASAISDQAELRVKEIPESTTEYKKYQEALNKKSNLYSNVLLYDISFILDGKEVEPTDGNVKVSMSFKDQQLSDDLNVKDNNDLKVIHFKDNDVNKQEVLNSSIVLKEEQITFTTKSFSIVGLSTDKPNRFLTTNTFISDGGEYTIEYLLKHYGVVSPGNVVLNNHTMANVLIGGNLSGSGAGFSDANEAAKMASSYIKGHIYFTGNYASRGGQNEKLKPLYIGTSNIINWPKNGNAKINGVDYWTLTDNSNNNQVYMTDSYVDWNLLENAVKSESKELSDRMTNVANADQSGQLTVNVGQSVTINTISDVKKINVVGDASKSVNTVINIPSNGDVRMPELLLNGVQANVSEKSAGDAVVFNFTNATSVTLPNLNWFGHVIAPNADVKMDSGNYNGGMICKSFTTGAEGHLYPYNGGTLIPVKAGFTLKKTVDGNDPKGAENNKFSFSLDEAATFNNKPDWNKLTRLQDTKNDGTNVTFDTINYNREGTHYYKISEQNIDGYKASNDIYVKVSVTSQKSGEDTIFNATVSYYNSNKLSDPIKDPTINNFKNVKAEVSVLKTVDNKIPSKEFKFGLYDGSLINGTFQVKNKQEKDKIEEKTNDTSEGLVTFSDESHLTYDEVGTHYYMISEDDVDANYVSSGNIYVKVDVRKSADGKKLETDVSYYKDPKFNEKIDVSGTNKPTINNTSVKFVLKKTDAEDNSKTLSNAKFTLQKLNSLNENTNTLEIGDNVTSEPVSTDDSGLATFNNLSKNKSYLLTETKAPNGYDVSGPWLVIIKNNGKIEFKAIKFNEDSNTNYSVIGSSVKNFDVLTIDTHPASIGDKQKKYTLPSTGGIGTKKYYLLGTLLSMLGVIYIVMKLGKGGTFKKKEHS